MTIENNAGGGGVNVIVGFETPPKPDYIIMTSPDCISSSSSSSTDHCTSSWWSFWWWGKLAFLVMFLAVLAFCFFVWIGPYLMEKEVIPILNWETKTFSKPVLAVLIFASVALFPTFFIPSTPSMWVAGMSFGYGLGFLVIISGVSIGVSLPYFFGSLYYHKIQGWLDRYPKKASIIKLAGEGDWYDQFRAVTLLRISPFPYAVYNYCAVATDVKFVPYLCGTLVGMVPEIFVAIYTTKESYVQTSLPLVQGHVNPSKANNPGQVFDIAPDDYIPYLCGLGYASQEVGIIVTKKVSCSKTIPEGQLNYPSFAVTLSKGENKTYSRTVTNVGEADSIYSVSELNVNLPHGIVLTIHNPTLKFIQVNQKLTYELTFTRVSNVEINVPYADGSMAWYSGKYLVRTPFAFKFV